MDEQPDLVPASAQDKEMAGFDDAKDAMSETLSDRIAPAVASLKANFDLGNSEEANKLAKECITFLEVHGFWSRIVQDAQNYRVKNR